MRALAIHTESVERGNAERRGEIAVAAAACLQVLKLEADLGADRLGMVEQLLNAFILFIGRTVDPAGDLHPPVRIVDLQAEDLANHLIRSEEHTSELQSPMRISHAVFRLK